MSKKADTTKKKKIFRWRNLLFLVLIFFFCFRLGSQVVQYYDLKEEAEHYREQLNIAEAEYQKQLDKQELLYNESYLERMARERLGMVKAGESVVSIMDIDIPETEDDIKE